MNRGIEDAIRLWHIPETQENPVGSPGRSCRNSDMSSITACTRRGSIVCPQLPLHCPCVYRRFRKKKPSMLVSLHARSHREKFQRAFFCARWRSQHRGPKQRIQTSPFWIAPGNQRRNDSLRSTYCQQSAWLGGLGRLSMCWRFRPSSPAHGRGHYETVNQIASHDATDTVTHEWK